MQSECPVQKELRKKMLKKILSFKDPYDPLIIKMKGPQYWFTNRYILTCNAGLKIDEELFEQRGESYFPNPYHYHKVQHLRLKIKHAIVEIDYSRSAA